MTPVAKIGGVSGDAIVTTDAAANYAWTAGTLGGGIDGIITVDETAIQAGIPLLVDIPGVHVAAPEHVGEPYLQVDVASLTGPADVVTFDVMGSSW